MHAGPTTEVARGRLPGEWGPETFSLQRAQYEGYAVRQVLDQIEHGADRIQISGVGRSNHLNVSPRVLAGLARLIEMDERGELS